jgi:hypothetical protein
MWALVVRDRSAGRRALGGGTADECRRQSRRQGHARDHRPLSGRVGCIGPTRGRIAGRGQAHRASEARKEALEIANAAIAGGATVSCCYGARQRSTSAQSHAHDPACRQRHGPAPPAPRTAREKARSDREVAFDESGLNYLPCRFAFGDITCDEALQSVELFNRHVKPTITPAREDAGDSHALIASPAKWERPAHCAG